MARCGSYKCSRISMAITVSNESDSHSNEWMSQQISGLVVSVMSSRR